MKKLGFILCLLISITTYSQTRTVNVGAGGAAPALGAVLAATPAGKTTGSINLTAEVRGASVVAEGTGLYSTGHFYNYKPSSANYVRYSSDNITADWILQAPNKSGTIATTADVGSAPIATATSVGTVKPGTGLSVTADGTLNASGSSVSSWAVFSATSATSQTVTGQAFQKVNLTTVVIDNLSGFNAGISGYTIQEAGTYSITGKIRLQDQSNNAIMGYGVGMNTGLVDNPSFLWTVTSPTTVGRAVGLNTRIMTLTAGEVIYLYTYIDVGSGTPPVVAAELSIWRIR